MRSAILLVMVIVLCSLKVGNLLIGKELFAKTQRAGVITKLPALRY